MTSREEKSHCGEVAHLVANKRANVGSSSVSNRDDLDGFGIIDGARSVSGKASSEVDVPVRAKPDQALDGDDGSDPDKGPFLSADMFLVELGAEVVSQEDGPYYYERPNIGVPMQGKLL